MPSKVTIMRGLPGSGKSTWIRKNLPGATVCSADDFFQKDGAYAFKKELLDRAHAECMARFVEALGRGDPEIAVDNTNILPRHFERYLHIAARHDAQVVVQTVPVAVDDACARNVHRVPRYVIERMARQAPDLVA